MKLHPEWKGILKRAWSVRFIVLAGMLSSCETLLPYFVDSMPRGLFAIATIVATVGAGVTRVIQQDD